MEENEARRLAEEFGRGLTDKWDEWGFVLGRLALPAGSRGFAFTWYPTARDEQGRERRIGGNVPIFVDPATGTCRHLTPRERLTRPGRLRAC
ncbi:hypothetical protein LG634_16785 [Streptomyces bambusae]|uniref:hypothetical protein n=1 Tax=Streptomyces bambusae TaxID=1550616 RepID=UPI001CFCDBBB|nr:hypothetical protein [Streptomyces bambusae]MCB5166489.1 hypothetical protein [Streptomyces bambusae]